MPELRYVFVGVDTSGSAVRAAFPRWLAAVGLEGRLECVDLPLDSSIARYRDLVGSFRADDGVKGALVTSHKTALFEAAADLFDTIEPLASLAREISVVLPSRGGLTASVVEPFSIRACLEDMLTTSTWGPGRDLLVLGAGGTASSLLISMFEATVRGHGSIPAPARVVLVDVLERRLAAARLLLDRLAPGVEVVTLVNEAAAGVDPLALVGQGALVVNATGLGKDRPGSPIELPAAWPRGAIVWECNYRGERPFLRDALAQAATRDLHVHDGWQLFLHGWGTFFERLLDRPMTPDERARFESTVVQPEA
jgi:shikimate 5-dehydrogenase